MKFSIEDFLKRKKIWLKNYFSDQIIWGVNPTKKIPLSFDLVKPNKKYFQVTILIDL